MIWNHRKKPTQSTHALELVAESERQLHEARSTRVEAFELGASLNHSRTMNHFGIGLERAMMMKRTMSS